MKPLISIDIFDTAIFRDVFEPKDVFTVIERKIGNNFKAERIKAQDAMRTTDINYTLADIYNLMPTKFTPKEEIIAEVTGATANPYILDLYNSGEYDCIFISDMYLPSSVLVKLLEHAGYKNPKVFVSCEEKALKVNGELFRKVEQKLGRKITKHIGDNYNVDIKGAKKEGIEPEFIGPAIYSRKVQTPVLESPRLRKIMIDEELDHDTTAFKIGYMFAPLAWKFLEAVLKEAKDNQTIFFNARDGFVLYLMARWILKTDKKIKYCRFSRKSVHLPNIDLTQPINSKENLLSFNFLKTTRVDSVLGFIKAYRLDKDYDYSEFLNKYGIELDTNIEFMERQKIIEDFVITYQDIIYARCKNEKNNFMNYIKTLGMKDGDIFIDLGHFGTMQSLIRKIAGISLKGRYIHMFQNERKCFDFKEDKTSFLPRGFLHYYTGVAELVFSEPVGTVIGYRNNGTSILNRDVKFRKFITKDILRGLLACVRKIKEKSIEVTYQDCIDILSRLLDHPTFEESKFGNQELFENGSPNKNESIVWYDKEQFKKGMIQECYRKSYWKPAFKVLMDRDPQYKKLISECK